MNERRSKWTELYGPIPKGWVVHSLNGNTADLSTGNLAAVPRKPEHVGQVTAPYVVRIRNLERELKLSREN